MNKKLQVKDLMTVGIFTALYLVVIFASMMLGYLPIIIPFLGGVMAIFGAIPCILYISKVDKFGMVSLMGVLSGLVFFLMGSGVIVLLFGIVFGLLADLVMKSGGYKDLKRSILGYAIFSLWSVGFSLRMYIDRTNFFASQLETYGKDYVDTLISLTPTWTLPVIIIITFISGLIGAKLGVRIFKKHFMRIGIK